MPWVEAWPAGSSEECSAAGFNQPPAGMGLTGLGEEGGGLYDHAGNPTHPYQSGIVGGRDGESEPPALDFLQGGLSGDLGAHPEGGEMVELDPNADCGVVPVELSVESSAAGFLAESDKSRGGEEGDLAGSHGLGGVGVLYSEDGSAHEAGFEAHRSTIPGWTIRR